MPDTKVLLGKDRDWTPEYALIGEFVDAFERSCSWLRQGALGILQFRGLKQAALGEILLNHRVLTADPLFSVYASLAAEAAPTSEEVRTAFSKPRNRFADLCKLRNDLLHSHYVIGPDFNVVTGGAKPPDIQAQRWTPDKAGTNIVNVASSAEEMRAHIREAWEAKEQIVNLVSTVMGALVATCRVDGGT